MKFKLLVVILRNFLFKIDELAESLAFLHQNDMKILIVIGDRNGSNLDREILKVNHRKHIDLTFTLMLFKNGSFIIKGK